jgi:hypothetical protein
LRTKKKATRMKGEKERKRKERQHGKTQEAGDAKDWKQPLYQVAPFAGVNGGEGAVLDAPLPGGANQTAPPQLQLPMLSHLKLQPYAAEQLSLLRQKPPPPLPAKDKMAAFRVKGENRLRATKEAEQPPAEGASARRKPRRKRPRPPLLLPAPMRGGNRKNKKGAGGDPLDFTPRSHAMIREVLG